MKTHLGKISRARLMTAIVGSYPKPGYLFARSGRELLDEMGMTLYGLEEELGAEVFSERMDRATLMAIQDQDEAGIDFVTDGEERRGHYVLYVLRKLAGIDFKRLTETPIRDGRYHRSLPTVVGEIVYKNPILVGDFDFTAQHTSAIPKIGLPGPSTVVDSVADAYYHGDRERMAFDYAAAIHHEVANLVETGCRAIQFDDPVLLRHPRRAQRWGLAALQACFVGLEDRATFFVHICRGYPDKPLERLDVEYKAAAVYYADILGWLSDSALDVVSIEGAQGNLDLGVLPAIGAKTVMLGVLDVGSNRIESAQSLVQRGRDALRHLPSEQLILAPDCGMLQLSRDAAKQKLVNLAIAAEVLNG